LLIIEVKQMVNKSLSLILGIGLSLTVMGGQTFAYPNRVRFNPNAGVHRTIIRLKLE
jgi:hypothetical protein